MSLYKRGKVWWSRIEVNKEVYQFSTGTGNKNEARNVEAEFRTSKQGVKGVPTFETFASEFIGRLPAKGIKGPTFQYYSDHLQPLLGSPLAKLLLDQIDADAIDGFVAARQAETPRPAVATINHNLRTLRRSLRLAQEWGRLNRVPKIHLLPDEHQRDYVISDEDIDRFSHCLAIVPFACDMGLRRRERIELKWTEVSETDVRIRRGKSKYARRRVPLTDRAK